MSEQHAGERADLAACLQRQRGSLRQTVRGLTEQQARARPTVSALTLGGLVKHVADTEDNWARFAQGDPSGLGGGAEFDAAAFAAGTWVDTRFTVGADDTLAGLLARYDAVAARTDAAVATLDLDTARPLPAAPWFEPGASWTVRRVLLHVVAETSQHAGHADLLRESIDGATSTG